MRAMAPVTRASASAFTAVRRRLLQCGVAREQRYSPTSRDSGVARQPETPDSRRYCCGAAGSGDVMCKRVASGGSIVLLVTGLLAPATVTRAAAEPASGKAVVHKVPATPSGQCRKSYGRGAAPTERLARLQAWERVAQATGNWPVVTDTFRNETYSCVPIAGGWRCRSSILVCRKL